MELETKHLLALVVLFTFGSATVLGTLISQRMRDWALFGLIVGAVFMSRMDVMLFGTFWYRGTSRGIQLSAVDFLPVGLFLATLILPRYHKGRFYWPAGLGLMLLFFAYCCLSVCYAEPRLHGVWELAKMLRGLVVFLAAALFVRTRRELMIAVLALAAATSLEAMNALEQRMFKGAIRPPGTLDHANTLSTYLCMIAPVLIAAAMSNWSKWVRWAAGVAWLFSAGGVVLTLSRLGVPVFFLVSAGTALACTSTRITRRKVAIATVCVGAVGFFLFLTWPSLKSRYEHSDIRAEFTDEKGFETRGVYWRLAFLMVRDHPYGVGLNNWSYYVGKSYGNELGYRYNDYDDIKWIPTREDAVNTLLPPAADSLPALTLGELGKAGLVLSLVVWLRWLWMGAVFLRNRLNDDPMHRIAIGILFGTLGVFLQSVTEWTYKQPPVFFTSNLLIGVLASLYFSRRRALAAAKRARREEADTDVIDVAPMPVVTARMSK